MFSTSFRIPFDVFGKTQYINGSCQTQNAVAKGAGIVVAHAKYGSASAEVIESRATHRQWLDYDWKLVR